MNLFIVSVYDTAVEAFGRPFTVQHSNQALRSFTDECNNKDSEIGRHPGDYTLHLVGIMDDQTGQISPMNERLARAIDLVKAN